MYTLYKRQKKNGTKFYVTFVNPVTGVNGTAKSVEVLAKELGLGREVITKRPRAEQIVRMAIDAGLAGESTKRTDINFVDYLLSFWDFDNSEFIRIENKLNPNSIGRDYAKNSLRNIENWVKPNIPAELKCSQVRTEHIEAVQSAVLKKCSGQTWKNVLMALRKPITELRRKKVLLADPLFDLRSVKTRNKTVSTVGTLTRREIDLILYRMYADMTEGREVQIEAKSKNGKEYKYPRQFKLDPRVYYAVALSAVTGMRMGEVLALEVGNIRFPNAEDLAEDLAIIDVCQAYAREQGMKLPKAKKTREVPCPRWLAEEMVSFAERTNPYGTGLVFYSDENPNTPISHSVINKFFRTELDFLKIDREGRNIRFHSLRHYFNTQSMNTVGGEQTRLVMGHESEDMSKLYFEATDEDIIRIGKTTTSFIGNPKQKEA